MNIEAIKEKIIELLENEFPEYKLVNSRDGFELQEEDNRKGIYFIINKQKSGSISLSVWCGIRHNEIENVFHKTSGIIGNNQLSSTTIAQSMEKPYRISDESEIIDAIVIITDFIKNTALPMLGKNYSSLEISQLLNTDPNGINIYQRNPHNRCCYGLISAKLSGDGCYEQCKQVYSNFMQASNRGFYYPKFEELIEVLESNA